MNDQDTQQQVIAVSCSLKTHFILNAHRICKSCGQSILIEKEATNKKKKKL